jgi:hypothetical protein
LRISRCFATTPRPVLAAQGDLKGALRKLDQEIKARERSVTSKAKKKK